MVDMKSVKKTPHMPLVETLERLLDDAKKGEIRGISYSVLWDDETTNHGWAFEYKKRVCAPLIGESFQLMNNLSINHNGINHEDIYY